MNECDKCWWYCHMDGKCYCVECDDYGATIYRKSDCNYWAFDGLKDWEREQPGQQSIPDVIGEK